MQQKPQRSGGSTLGTVLSLLSAFVATSVLLGILSAGLLIPAVAVAGRGAQSGVGFFDKLPATFETSPLQQQTRIEAADGSLIAMPFGENRRVVPLSRISKHMVNAQVAIEDERFYQHGGVDLKGIARATVSNLAGTSTSGGSTLTQQYVKLSLQEEALREGDLEKAAEATTQSGMAGYLRKLREVKYAVSLEKNSSKDKVLEGYLNLAYYGDRAYGVQAAARHYFNVDAADLNPAQAATLAGIVQSPGSTDPINNPRAAINRRNLVLFKMNELGYISDAQYRKAKASKLDLEPTYERSSCSSSKYAFFCSYVTEWLLRRPELGDSVQARKDRLNRGGLTIRTTMDPELVATAEKELRDTVPARNDYDIAAAAAVVEPGTGRVRAIAQNRPYGLDQGKRETTINLAVPQPYTATIGFPIGSTAKIFAMTNAMELGLPVDGSVALRPTTPLDSRDSDGQKVKREKAVFSPNEFPACTNNGSNYWAVQNDHGEFTDKMSFREATVQSANTAYSELVTALDPCEVQKTMTKVGLHKPTIDDQGAYETFSTVPSAVTLGSDGSVPLTVASAFATYAARGMRCEPYPVESITEFDGRALELKNRSCERALAPEVADAVTDIFKSVPERAATKAQLAGGRVSSGKTGTADESKHVWYAGFTPQLASAVWVGGVESPRALNNVRLNGTTYDGWLYGSTIAAPMWKVIMDKGHEGLPNESFTAVPAARKTGAPVPMPDVVGKSVFQARAELRKVGLLAFNESPWQGGDAIVQSTSPAAGAPADPRTWVRLRPDPGTKPSPAELEARVNASTQTASGGE